MTQSPETPVKKDRTAPSTPAAAVSKSQGGEMSLYAEIFGESPDISEHEAPEVDTTFSESDSSFDSTYVKVRPGRPALPCCVLANAILSDVAQRVSRKAGGEV